MITLEKIISSNLEMLDEQEKEILKALEFVRKAKNLFQGHGSSPAKKRGRKPKAKGKVAKTAAPKTVASKAPVAAANKKVRKDTNLSRIMDLLEQKNGQKTGDIAQKMFNKQSEVKDFPAYRQNIYNVISQSKKRKILKAKDGKIYLS